MRDGQIPGDVKLMREKKSPGKKAFLENFL
jgi:hypothetical protein